MLSCKNLPALIDAIKDCENREALELILNTAKVRVSELDTAEQRERRRAEDWREVGDDLAANPGRPLAGPK